MLFLRLAHTLVHHQGSHPRRVFNGESRHVFITRILSMVFPRFELHVQSLSDVASLDSQASACIVELLATKAKFDASVAVLYLT